MFNQGSGNIVVSVSVMGLKGLMQMLGNAVSALGKHLFVLVRLK